MSQSTGKAGGEATSARELLLSDVSQVSDKKSLQCELVEVDSEYVRIEYHSSDAVKKPRRGPPVARVNRKLFHHEITG